MSAAGSPIEISAPAPASFIMAEAGESANLYRNILEMSPSDFDAIHISGWSRSRPAGWKKRGACFARRWISVLPRRSMAALRHVAAASGPHDDAVIAYERAISLKPDYFDAMFCLGVTQKNAGRRDKALTVFNRFIAMRGGEYPALLHRGDLLREPATLPAHWPITNLR